MRQRVEFKPPTFWEDDFNCPHCGVYAHQAWSSICTAFQEQEIEDATVAYCRRCNGFSLWLGEKMIVPSSGTAPLPSPDLPAEIKADYLEAREIVARSPRGAAALLRLCIQKLCAHLGESGKNINQDIANLVKQDLPSRVQKALDTVRVTGNNAVHPGQMDLEDNAKTAERLFGLVNFITEKMITEPGEIDTFYDELPEDTRKVRTAVTN